MKSKEKKKYGKLISFVFFVVGILFVLMFREGLEYTSTNTFCESCHVHPQATSSWRLSTHFDNKSGMVTNCVDCHLPPKGFDYLSAKTGTGLRDVYGILFKDESQFNWEAKSTREVAEKHVYKASCVHCHQNLFPRTLSKKGEDAHLYYDQNKEKLRCISCHLEVGHFHKVKPQPEELYLAKEEKREIYKYPAQVDSFASFTETIPGSVVSFEMIAIRGGTFLIGSPQDEAFRQIDEGPQKDIEVSDFFIGKIEVTWTEYDLFLKETGVQGRTEDQYKHVKGSAEIDAVTGPTPPYGNPDQGWGKGGRPAITMTHHAARKYCEWLSKKTGKNYRLPTEAEWEYACRGGTHGAYFFEGRPEDISSDRFWNKIFGADTSVINDYAVYAQNSRGKTYLSTGLKPNPFGLINMLGNVREFCSDIYEEDFYNRIQTKNPENINVSGSKQNVIRGGSYKSPAQDLRCAARDYTRSQAWLLTDPQIPKSMWWYSDCNDVGFRIVCEPDVNFSN